MRKSLVANGQARPSEELQCGRIYKDAEIWSLCRPCSARHRELQCGRIYKDAEICVSGRVLRDQHAGFNVAASIKMRKFRLHDRDWEALKAASMWPHL